MSAEEKDDIAGATSVSDMNNEISFTIRPRRAPASMPCKTKPRTPVAGRMAETLPSPEKEHFVNKTVDQLVMEDFSSPLSCDPRNSMGDGGNRNINKKRTVINRLE